LEYCWHTVANGQGGEQIVTAYEEWIGLGKKRSFKLSQATALALIALILENSRVTGSSPKS
jgi:hypothetical protein